MTVLNTASANANTTVIETAKAEKINKDAAYSALKNLTLIRRQVEGKPEAPKKAERAAKKEEHAKHRKEVALDLLTRGKGASKQWTIRYALQRAVNAIKGGVSNEELRNCTALMELPWGALEEPVREYAVAVKADPDAVTKALCVQAVELVMAAEKARLMADLAKPAKVAEAPKAAEPTEPAKAAPKAAEAPKAAPKAAEAPKAATKPIEIPKRPSMAPPVPVRRVAKAS